eukprot:8094005-Pyramimonas_sp.AAC.1
MRGRQTCRPASEQRERSMGAAAPAPRTKRVGSLPSFSSNRPKTGLHLDARARWRRALRRAAISRGPAAA